MRDIIIVLILAAVLLTAVFCNAAYVRSSADYIMYIAEKLVTPDHRGAAIAELKEFWETNQVFLSFSVPRDELEAMGDLMVSLDSSIRLGESTDPQNFEAARMLLYNAALRMKRGEEIRADNIF